MRPISLRLMGPVELIGHGAQRLTPRGMRARGALAVMGCSRGMRLKRARLQDLLFSTRDPENANDSLRQVLREIRIAMGEYRTGLVTGPGWVGLDSEMVSLDMTARVGPDGRLPEFAEDLDIPDPEFEDWLRDARSHAEATSQPVETVPASTEAGTMPVLLTTEPVASDTETAVTAAIIMGEAAGRVCDLMPLVSLPDQPGQHASAIVLSSVASRVGEAIHLLLKLNHRPSGRLFWSQKFVLERRDLAQAMAACSAQTCVGIMRVIEAVRTIDAALGVSFADVFSFSQDRLSRADQALSSLDHGVNTALTLALRAWVRTTLVFERLVPDTHSAILEAQEFAAKAREADPYSATALAVGSMVEGYLNQGQVSFFLAQQAVRVDERNPIARYAYSQALTDLGQHDKARTEAEAGLAETLSVLNPATWQLRIGVAMTRLGRFVDAERHFDAVQQFAPENRPSLRFLAALRYKRRDEEGALTALSRLRQIEPGFSLDLMGSDQYPVATLRQGGLLGVTKSRLI